MVFALRRNRPWRRAVVLAAAVASTVALATWSSVPAEAADADVSAPLVGQDGPAVGGAINSGYLMAADSGAVVGFGTADKGSASDLELRRPIVDIAGTPSGNGYWLVASDGGLFSFGDAGYFGSTGSLRLNQPIVGMAASPSGQGYWMVASDGGIFTYGDAPFFGSTGAVVLNKPIAGMAATQTGGGYWLVATDGGVFTFGDATFKGATPTGKFDGRIIGILPQGGDVRGPALRHLSFGPRQVDTSSGDAEIRFRVNLTDDLSGVIGGGCPTIGFRAPNRTIVQVFFCRPDSGDARDGIYKSVMRVPQNSPKGVWTLDFVQIGDGVGNLTSVNGTTMAQAGYPTTFEQVGAGDSEAPHIRALSVSPSTIDTSTGSAQVTVRARFTDDHSGLMTNGTQVRFTGDGGGAPLDVVFWSARLVSGDVRDGTWETTLAVPANSAAGYYRFDSALLTDMANNTVYRFAREVGDFSAGFRQVGAGDTTPPRLEFLDYGPRILDTSQQAATFIFTARISDTGAGAATTADDRYDSTATFTSATGQTVNAYLGWSNFISGDHHDATYRTTVTVPLHSEQGTWTLTQVHLGDVVGNQTNIATSALAAAGYPTTFEVVRTASN